MANAGAAAAKLGITPVISGDRGDRADHDGHRHRPASPDGQRQPDGHPDQHRHPERLAHAAVQRRLQRRVRAEQPTDGHRQHGVDRVQVHRPHPSGQQESGHPSNGSRPAGSAASACGSVIPEDDAPAVRAAGRPPGGGPEVPAPGRRAAPAAFGTVTVMTTHTVTLDGRARGVRHRNPAGDGARRRDGRLRGRHVHGGDGAVRVRASPPCCTARRGWTARPRAPSRSTAPASTTSARTR